MNIKRGDILIIKFDELTDMNFYSIATLGAVYLGTNSEADEIFLNVYCKNDSIASASFSEYEEFLGFPKKELTESNAIFEMHQKLEESVVFYRKIDSYKEEIIINLDEIDKFKTIMDDIKSAALEVLMEDSPEIFI